MAKLYFFEGRNTGIYANSAAEARKKCKRGCGKIVKVLNKTPPKNGGWDRTRKDGKSPAKSAHKEPIKPAKSNKPAQKKQ